MKRKLLIGLAILAVTCWVGTAGAVTFPTITGTDSDVLVVVWDNVQQNRVLIEGPPAENVTADLIFAAGNLNQNDFSNTNAFLVELGSLTGQTQVNTNGVTISQGQRSDTINFNISNNDTGFPGQTVHFNINSDEQQFGNNVFGLEETNGYLEVTNTLFTATQLGLITAAGHSVQVFAFSGPDVVPVPPSALLLGSGLLGLVGLGWRRKRG